MPVAFDELSWIKEYRFPLDQGSKTVYECLKDWLDDYNGHIATTTFLTAEEKKQIKGFSEGLLTAFELYPKDLSVEPTKAIEAFSRVMNSIKEHLLSVKIGQTEEYWNDNISYYRIVSGTKGLNYLGMLHVPEGKKNLASENRFSPRESLCSYMASDKTVAWHECGTPDIYQLAEFEAVKQDTRLLRLDINPVQVMKIVNMWERVQINQDEMERSCSKICFTLPLIAACSVVAKDKGKKDGYIEAYILPQMLMEWVRKGNDYVGIRYYSSSSHDEVRDYTGYNVALPVKYTKDGEKLDVDHEGYSNELKEIFGILDHGKGDFVPTIVKMNSVFPPDESRLEKVRQFLHKITWIEEHYESTSELDVSQMLRETCIPICKVIISTLELVKKEGFGGNTEIVTLLSELPPLCAVTSNHLKSNLPEKAEDDKTDEQKLCRELAQEFAEDVRSFVSDINRALND